MTTTDYTMLTDVELNARLEAVRTAVTAPRLLDELEQESERRQRDTEAQRVEREALLDRLAGQVTDLRARFIAALDDMTIEESYILGRQWYALSHDLLAVTGDRRRFAAPWDVTDQLVLHGGRKAEAFVASLRGRSIVVPTPWKQDLERLRALWPPAELRVGNGG